MVRGGGCSAERRGNNVLVGFAREKCKPLETMSSVDSKLTNTKPIPEINVKLIQGCPPEISFHTD